MNFAPLKNRKSEFGSQHLRTARDNEYLAFSRVTRQLQQAMISNDLRAMIEGAHANNQLWTILAADLTHPANTLPEAIKAGLLSLAIFSIKQGHRVLSENASAEALIDINLKIMKGLRGEAQP
ncbi:flagellar protein FlaF [Paracoccus aminovorans]|uniref:Flagellar protein FlaF n=1 Tax=Paracoccus aminovorans TaxID=34004 RepID=A0A1I3C591_9RHOB|nr:flagellar biosynthesis regulator FlaF [Paracoccus aminovorans]CQR84498.1 flagellar biosynthesis regulatory protein FlaF [Paracoccus aminovorans]SFH69748.1 flagellar protein FlaF [Paracoccus aminovorans]